MLVGRMVALGAQQIDSQVATHRLSDDLYYQFTPNIPHSFTAHLRPMSFHVALFRASANASSLDGASSRMLRSEYPPVSESDSDCATRRRDVKSGHPAAWAAGGGRAAAHGFDARREPLWRPCATCGGR